MQHKLTFANLPSDPIHSPLFDGSTTSLGGNGEYYNHTGIPIPVAPPGVNDVVPPAEGGGCVTSGPFKK
jgi:tyrosinase